eukprot:m.170131 g.170131  ORF g.170131 m.170131 type:complete len:82 (-) comp13201_c0_seq1:260-505(-)
MLRAVQQVAVRGQWARMIAASPAPRACMSSRSDGKGGLSGTDFHARERAAEKQYVTEHEHEQLEQQRKEREAAKKDKNEKK